MIYFLDNSLQLQKIVTSKNVISAIHEHELNGLIRADVELDLSYANKFLVLGIDHVGYYYKDEFYLHKIQRVEYDHANESVKIVLRHIFFEDMIFGKLIQDVRPQNQDALTVSRQTIDANTRWQTIMTDVTGRLSTNFYWQVPYEVIEFMTENYRIEYLPKILFDGQKINGFQLHLANNIGEDKNIRIPYGSRVLDLKYEEDYSEIITKLVVHGKGEEVGDGYGRRINISDVNFSRNGVESPVGSLYLEDETITNTYGNDGQTPREGREVFEDIEDANELAEAGYQHYLQVSRPQMLFTADVADIGDVGIGDSVMIIRREYDVYFNARIHKLSVDLLYPEDAQVELGDYEHFRESKIARKSREKNNQLHKRNQSLIEQAKRDFDENFNSAVEQFRNEFEQAKIDILAEVEADRVRMEAEFNQTINNWTESFNEDVEEAYRKAEENYERISGEITTAVDTARGEIEQGYNDAVEEAKRLSREEHDRISGEVTNSIDTAKSELEQGYTDAMEQAKRYAEEQSKAHADAVENKLDAVTGSHAGMLADLESNVMDIDEFLGDSRSLTLDERFQDITMSFEERIRNIDSTHFNMIRGTSFDNPDLYSNHATVEIITNETDNFARLGLGTTSLPYVMPNEYFNVEAGETYNLIFTYRTADVPEIDFIRLRPPSGYGGDLIVEDNMTESEKATTLTNQWTKKTVSFVSDRDMPVRLLLGTNFGAGNTQRGILDIKKPYLTTTNNREWLPHPDDDTQNVSEIIRRVTLLEDGRSELITRSEYDFDTGNLDQYIKSVEETVEGNKQVLQRVDNWQSTNGASIEETIYGFNQKVWLNDVANIGANLIPQSSNAWENGGLWIEGGGVNALNQHIRTKERLPIQPNTTYTLSSDSAYVSAIERVDIHQYLYTGGWITRHTIPRNGQVTFTTWSTASHVRIALIAREGFSIQTSFVDHPDGRIKIKLEVGNKATPMLNAISRIEQLANSVSIQVQELDGDFLSQSEIKVHPGYVQLGSQRLGDSQFASIFRVSPNSIQAITDRMILNGDLYVDGDITALAVEAIEGRFSNLWAAEFESTTILAKHIASDAIQSRHLLVSNAMVEKIVANNVYADDVNAKAVNAINGRFASLFAAELETVELRAKHIGANAIGAQHLWIDTALINKLSSSSLFTDLLYAKTINAIDINAGQVRSAILEADVITSTHLSVGTAMIKKLFATSGRIDELITKSHFVTNIKAMSIEAVEGEFSSLITKYLSANYIDVDYIYGKNAWFETQYIKDANIAELTAQTAFIRDIQAIEITANQLSINTLHSKLAGTEGGLTIYGPDGRVLINNSMLRASFDVQVYDSYASSEVGFTGLNYHTESTNWQTFKYFYTDFKGSQLLISWAVSYTGGSTSEMIGARVRGFGGSNPIGTNAVRLLSENGSTRFYNQVIDLGVPNYNTIQAYLEFRRDPDGIGNRVLARVLRVSLIN